MSMKAVRCHEYGPPESLRFEDIDAPKPGQGETLIEICATGLNFPDTLQIQGKYQFQPPFPFIPASEVAGIVRELGSDTSGIAVGDRVMAMVGIGGMAEYVCAPVAALDRIPVGMDMPSAAGFNMVYGTSYHALKQRADLQPGETLLVLGAGGGVGLTAVELGKALGARVIAAARTDEKLDVARQHGADDLINYSDGELKEKVKTLTNGQGADVIYDPVGGELFDQCARCINWKGRILVIGFASGKIPEYRTNLALLKGCSLVGVFWGDFRRREPEVHRQNMEDLFALFASGKIRPEVKQTLPLEKYADALNILSGRKAIGKVVLEVKKE
jgi:NADPH:quinone reductase